MKYLLLIMFLSACTPEQMHEASERYKYNMRYDQQTIASQLNLGGTSMPEAQQQAATIVMQNRMADAYASGVKPDPDLMNSIQQQQMLSEQRKQTALLEKMKRDQEFDRMEQSLSH